MSQCSAPEDGEAQSRARMRWAVGGAASSEAPGVDASVFGSGATTASGVSSRRISAGATLMAVRSLLRKAAAPRGRSSASVVPSATEDGLCIAASDLALGRAESPAFCRGVTDPGPTPELTERAASEASHL